MNLLGNVQALAKCPAADKVVPRETTSRRKRGSPPDGTPCDQIGVPGAER